MRSDEALAIDPTQGHGRDVNGSSPLGGHHLLCPMHLHLSYSMADSLGIYPAYCGHNFNRTLLILEAFLGLGFSLLKAFAPRLRKQSIYPLFAKWRSFFNSLHSVVV